MRALWEMCPPPSSYNWHDFKLTGRKKPTVWVFRKTISVLHQRYLNQTTLAWLHYHICMVVGLAAVCVQELVDYYFSVNPCHVFTIQYFGLLWTALWSNGLFAQWSCLFRGIQGRTVFCQTMRQNSDWLTEPDSEDTGPQKLKPLGWLTLLLLIESFFFLRVTRPFGLQWIVIGWEWHCTSKAANTVLQSTTQGFKRPSKANQTKRTTKLIIGKETRSKQYLCTADTFFFLWYPP